MSRRDVLCGLLAYSLATCFRVPASSADEKPVDYFPVGALHERADLDRLLREWFSKHLLALQEPNLFPAESGREVYRFTWLRSSHNPMTFRLAVASSGTGIINVKRANGRGGYEPGEIDLNIDIAVSKPRVTALKRELGNMGFWQKSSWLDNMSLDGARWIVETDAEGIYKIVHRSSGSDRELQDWCMSLIALSGIDVGDIY